MADSETANLELVLPEVGASTDTWGTKLNSNFMDLDALFNEDATLKVTAGGTGLATFTAAGRIVRSTAATTLAGLALGTARQLLQVNAGATDLEWASNIDIPGTLDVTGAMVFDSTLRGAGAIATSASAGEIILGTSLFLRGTNNATTDTVPVIGLGGNDRIRFGHARSAAGTPGNFAANFYIEFEDVAGAKFFVPAMNAAW